MDIEELRRFAPGAKEAILAGILEGWDAAKAAGITTPLRICHFMAQIFHESASFATTVEYASGAAYEGRKDLGNTRPGDGKRYRGRGLIQCTGRANYLAFTGWAKATFPNAPDFEAQPERLADMPWAFISAVWFWQSKGLNAEADGNAIRAITRKINGGYNGLDDRRAAFRRALKVWGDGDINPNGKPFAASRSVKAGAVALGGAGAIGAASEMASQASSIATSTKAVAEALDVPAWSIAAGAITLCLVVGILYMLWDRYFIYKHEGL